MTRYIVLRTDVIADFIALYSETELPNDYEIQLQRSLLLINIFVWIFQYFKTFELYLKEVVLQVQVTNISYIYMQLAVSK